MRYVATANTAAVIEHLYLQDPPNKTVILGVNNPNTNILNEVKKRIRQRGKSFIFCTT